METRNVGVIWPGTNHSLLPVGDRQCTVVPCPLLQGPISLAAAKKTVLYEDNCAPSSSTLRRVRRSRQSYVRPKKAAFTEFGAFIKTTAGLDALLDRPCYDLPEVTVPETGGGRLEFPRLLHIGERLVLYQRLLRSTYVTILRARSVHVAGERMCTWSPDAASKPSPPAFVIAPFCDRPAI